MKIAIIGNMNNSGFSILRYFKDLGVDARLYCYRNDAEGGLAHFAVDSDTWNIERWVDYIEVLPFDNSFHSIYPPPLNMRNAAIKSVIREIADNHPITIGCGAAPALFAKAGRSLTAFFPYGTGVEFLGDVKLLALMQRSKLKRPFHRYCQRLQTQGILDAKCCFNAELSLTRKTLQGIGRASDVLAIPAVYNREQILAASIPEDIEERRLRMRKYSFVVFCHSSQQWVRDPNLMSVAQYQFYTKNSDWLIRGFADFLKRGASDAILFLVEYGPDVAASKRLIEDLGIARHAIWLPRMKRKEIMYLLAHVDVGVGEFRNNPGFIWGGTGWEILASGKPLVQGFNFTHEGFKADFGHPPPPILGADRPEAITDQLWRMYESPDLRARISEESANWFNTHNGINLAREWLRRMGVADMDPVT